MTEDQINKLPKWRKDYLEIFGNTWKPRKFDGLGCEACVYGTARGEQHSEGCKARKFVAQWKELDVLQARENARLVELIEASLAEPGSVRIAS